MIPLPPMSYDLMGRCRGMLQVFLPCLDIFSQYTVEQICTWHGQYLNGKDCPAMLNDRVNGDHVLTNGNVLISVLTVCQVAKGMVGQSGRLLRDKMLQHFASVSQHAFSMMLDSQSGRPTSEFLRYPKGSEICTSENGPEERTAVISLWWSQVCAIFTPGDHLSLLEVVIEGWFSCVK